MSKAKQSTAGKAAAPLVTGTAANKAVLQELELPPAKNVTTNKWFAALMVLIVSFVVFVNSKENNFVLDDHGIIKSNKITKGGISMETFKTIFTTSHRKGDVSDLEHSLYRPLVKAVFAVEWQWGNGDPKLFHWGNIYFYMLLCLCIYLVLYHAFKKNWILALAITLLFAVHPIHSEVVANIKSLDEILGMLGTMLTIRCMQLYVDKKQILWVAAGFVAYMISILSKESNVVVIGLVPLVLYYFHDAKPKDLLIATGVVAFGFVLFFLARDNAIGKYGPMKPPSALDNVLALTRSDITKDDSYQMKLFIPTVVYLMGYYVYKLFFPVQLSCDYSYASVDVKTLGSWEFLVSLLFFVAIIAYTVYTFKKKDLIGFGVAWFLISSSIISNLVIVIGISFADRLMFLPSLGWAASVIGVVYKLLGYYKKDVATYSFAGAWKAFAGVAAVVLIFGIPFSIKAMQRNEEWKKDFTLFDHDIKYYPNSTHLMFYWGNHITSNEFAEGKEKQKVLTSNIEAISTFRRSLGFYPALPSDGYNQLGKAFYNLYKGRPEELSMTRDLAASSLSMYGPIVGQFLDSNARATFIDSANTYYLRAHREDTTNPVFMNNVGTVFFEKARMYSNMPWFDSAFKYFYGAHTRDTTCMDYMNNIGALRGTIGDRQGAIAWLYKAYKADSLELGAILSCKMIGGTYRDMGDPVNAKVWYDQAARVEAYRREQLLAK
jgi:protein O-mannosyl-transferase